jgi:hypothetical protein
MSKSIRVSTVENLVKPIADPSVPFVRTVINGYFLTISNLYNDTIVIQWLVVSPRPDISVQTPGEVLGDRTYTTSLFNGPANHTVIWDVTGGTSFGQTSVSELQYIGASAENFFYLTRAFKFRRGATAQLAILPFLGNPNVLLNPKLEIRSHLAMAILELGGAPRVNTNIPILHSAEQRGTFVPYNNPFTTNVAEVAQLNTSLTLASGQAENNVLWTPTPNVIPANVSSFATTNGIVTPGQLEPFVDVIRNFV